MKLAQLNIAKAKYSLDAVEIKDFVDNLVAINAIAEQSPGFIWRLKDESGDATHIQVFDDPDLLVNMSVWDSVESLKDFMFRTHHREFMRRKSEWFYASADATYVLWWVAENHTPDIQEAVSRLGHLRLHGATAYAFDFKTSYSKEDYIASRDTSA